MWRILLMVSLLCWSADGQDVTCRDYNNGEVDWYIIYKAPKLNNLKTEGLEYIYLYIDSAGKKKETLTTNPSYKPINDANGVLAYTLWPLFTRRITPMTKDFGFISYNDQPPPDQNGKTPSVGPTYGHSKGVVMMDEKTGVWLLHSVPKFPFKRDKDNFYPSSGAAKAQTFICVTFKYDQFNKIGQHLLDIRAFTFEGHIPDSFPDNLQKAKNKESGKRTPGEKIQELTSAGRTKFESIAKHNIERPTGGGKSRRRRTKYIGSTTKKDKKADPKKLGHTIKKNKKADPKRHGTSAAKLKDPNRFEGDLYLTIAKRYKTDVRVQTWGCQAGRDGSYCDGPQVIKIESVKTKLDKVPVEWTTKIDHSKWCVATDDSKNNPDLICIADVNRAPSQYERPGGGLCFIHEEASKLFKGLIAAEPCRRSRRAAFYKRALDSNPDCEMDCEADNPYCNTEPMEVE